ncbi:MAG TPA: UDP-N-acetylmuramoyl-L-alanyl-D-glutamate--2,6-diaminopimelate ligase [Steroidobacteraceae bacterium]|nr:UDP-N-acetylmuramoyl-L-alanyl-D-glutamate--2,6-diaminopimelate ligase [Steroidobacteraceae bacterium]
MSATFMSSAHALAELTAGLIAVPADLEVSDVTLDSRAVTPGALFLACRGRAHHGLTFLPQVLAHGARAVLYEPQGAPALPAAPAGAFLGAVPQLSEHAGLIAARFFGEPSHALTVAGITGTNGKTTCAWLLAQALNHCQRPAAYMGTLGFGRPPQVTATLHTTPDAVSVQRQLAALRRQGAECVCMEVSSHALDQSRVSGVRFHTAVFTNLTRDHLDYHGSMQAYGAAKARLFAWPELAARVINVDDPFGAALAAGGGAPLIVTLRQARSGVPAGARWVRATRVTAEPGGLWIDVDSSWGSAELTVRLVGEFNVDNALTVLAVLLAWEVPLPEAVRALSRSRAASGRMEMFGGRGRTPLAIVDYAHTPDALENALKAARLHCRGELRVVFGCGGDRDPGKRPLMGRIAAELADDIIVTDDNPRSEDPARIVAAILTGMSTRKPHVIEHDRALAIRLALERSGPEDVVLIAGKGHEGYQIVGHERREFHDQAVVSQELARLPP